MSLVAHELRTPLNTLYLETQMRKMQLAMGKPEALDPEQLRLMVARDERQIHAMIRLIEDMLDVSRMRSGMLSIRPAQMDLAAMLARVVSDLSRPAAEAGSPLVLDAPGPVIGTWDEFRIEQVIINLLTNALRYGGGKQVTIRLSSDGAAARIEVTDQGIGIPEDVQPRIFEPFERAAANEAPAGLGLGLYISRQLVEAHGGTLSVRSKAGEGSVFTVVLPREAA
jgi:signal transduction histidine kinase